MPALTRLFGERDRVVDVHFSEKELHAKVVRGGGGVERGTPAMATMPDSYKTQNTHLAILLEVQEG